MQTGSYILMAARGVSCSAAARILEVEVEGGAGMVTHIIAMSGTYMSTAVSSFVADLVGLDCCSEFLFNLISEMHSEASCGKRRRTV